MSKARIMGAGLAGSTTVDVNINGNQGGGNKKQGLPGISNMRSSLVFSVNQRAYATPDSRNKVFYINQLSRVGAKSTMFASTADGVKREPYNDFVETMNNVLNTLTNTYQSDYHLLLVGDSETLESDLRQAHTSLSDLQDGFFIKLKQGEFLFDSLDDNLKSNINDVNTYIGDPRHTWNQTFVGHHLLGLVQRTEENDNLIEELHNLGYGINTLSFKSQRTGVSTIPLRIYLRSSQSCDSDSDADDYVTVNTDTLDISQTGTNYFNNETEDEIAYMWSNTGSSNCDSN